MDAALDALLKRVSRSFYLSLRFLPSAVRGDLSLAYLLARLTDSIADSASAAVPERLEALERFLPELNATVPSEAYQALLGRFSDQMAHLGEKELLGRFADLWGIWQMVPPGPKSRAAWVLGTIVSGQMLDLKRFGSVPAPTYVESADQLWDYTYRVAGCVGEYWTDTLYAQIPGVCDQEQSHMRELGRRLGHGLQLTNILRDLHTDLALGRGYLPEAAQGNLAAAREIWLANARQCLRDASGYGPQLRGWSLRFTAELPRRLAEKTLDLIAQSPHNARVKISRATVWRTALAVALAACRPARPA
jgi:farnesyl-diphosphate farnesyltransferase